MPDQCRQQRVLAASFIFLAIGRPKTRGYDLGRMEREFSSYYKAWDASATLDYMPSQYITFRWEYTIARRVSHISQVQVALLPQEAIKARRDQ